SDTSWPCGSRPCGYWRCGHDALPVVAWPSRHFANYKILFRPSHIHLQGRDERLLRNVHLAELAHPLLAFLLFFQELALAGDVAAVALGGDILAKGTQGFAGDNFPANCRLDRNLEHVRRDQLLELLHHGATAAFGASPVDQHGERVDRFAVD